MSPEQQPVPASRHHASKRRPRITSVLVSCTLITLLSAFDLACKTDDPSPEDGLADDVYVPPTADPNPVDDGDGPGPADLQVDRWWQLYQDGNVATLATELEAYGEAAPDDEPIIATFEALVELANGEAPSLDNVDAATDVVAGDPSSTLEAAATVVIAEAFGDGLVDDATFGQVVDTALLDQLIDDGLIGPDVPVVDPASAAPVVGS